LILSTFPKVKP